MRYLDAMESESSEPLSRQERLELLDRAATSRQLRRATRLREFLLYVGKQAIEHNIEAIHEQEIGHAVFGRPENYDTSLDNIVRVNASELRKRLEQYFEEEGASEELILTIPRGGYIPQFSRRRVPATAAFYEVSAIPQTEEPTEVPVPLPAVQRPTSNRLLNLLLVAMAVSLVLVLLALVWQRGKYRVAMEPWRANSALSRFWAPFFANSGEVDIVLADTSLAMAKDISGRGVSLDSYIHFQYKQPSEWAGLSPDRQADLAQVLNRGNVSLGDVHVAQQLLSLNPYSQSLRLYSAREFNIETARQNSVILIGSRESNPWVDLFKEQMNFSVEYETATHRPYVTNRTPQKGELAVYEAPTEPTREHGYAVIASVRALHPDRNALIICGTDAQATRAAGEFVTNPDQLGSLLVRLSRNKAGLFEVLLRTTQLTGTPIRSEVVAVRVPPA